jgi:hypothetical protein
VPSIFWLYDKCFLRQELLFEFSHIVVAWWTSVLNHPNCTALKMAISLAMLPWHIELNNNLFCCLLCLRSVMLLPLTVQNRYWDLDCLDNSLYHTFILLSCFHIIPTAYLMFLYNVFIYFFHGWSI